MAAAKGGHDDVVRVLLDAGADVDACEENGKGALYYACYEGHVDGATSPRPRRRRLRETWQRPLPTCVIVVPEFRDQDNKENRQGPPRGDAGPHRAPRSRERKPQARLARYREARGDLTAGGRSSQ